MQSIASSFTAAAVQAAPVFLNKKQTVEKACDLIAEAAKNNARLVVFPEVFIAGYPDWVWLIPNSQSSALNELYVQLVENAVVIPDEAVEQLCKSARQNKVHIVMGVHERNTEASGASLYNTIIFIDDNGNLIGKHRKLIPTGGERLIWASGDGSTLEVFPTHLGKIGGLICWENYMPLARYAMYQNGAQVLATPTWDKSGNWLLSMQHIAREGGMFIISCCSAIRIEDIPDGLEFKSLYPSDREWVNIGNSCIVNPFGKIIAGPVSKEETIIYAEIHLPEIIAAKRMFDAAGHYARPDVFQFSVGKNLH